MSIVTLPAYSDTLVNLARAYDRAALAVRASNWHLSSLRDDAEFFVEGDDSLPDWARSRIGLLEEQLPAMACAVHTLLVVESKPWFDVITGGPVGIEMPDVVARLLEPGSKAAFYYGSHEEGVAMTQPYLADHYAILFDGDGYILPRSYPKSFIEIWWRRNWLNVTSETYYQLALVENPAYGWDCYGHER